MKKKMVRQQKALEILKEKELILVFFSLSNKNIKVLCK